MSNSSTAVHVDGGSPRESGTTLTGSPDAESTVARARGCRVVLAGWYGAANLGDELLLKVIAGWVREAGGTPIAISTHPDYTTATMGIEAVGYGDLPAIAEALAGADLFALGGGGLFQDYNEFDVASLARFPAWNVSQYAQFLFLADELGVPAIALAQGVGPLRGGEGRQVAADVFGRALGVSVRDADSARLLCEIGLQREPIVAPDPAWSWRPAAGRAISLRERYPMLEDRPVLAMILRDWPFDPGWEAACVAALREAIPPNWGVLWLDFHRPPNAAETGFSEVAQRVVAQLGSRHVHVVWDGATVDEAAELLGQCDACVAMRLHGVLLAVAGGLPVVAIEYDGKVTSLDEEIGIPASQRVALDGLRERLPRRSRASSASHPWSRARARRCPISPQVRSRTATFWFVTWLTHGAVGRNAMTRPDPAGWRDG